MARPISSSDDELDRLALRVANDPDQFPRLESAMRYVVAKIASTIYGTYCHDRDDMRQLTSIGLWEAVVSYSPARGRFRSYAWVVIHRRLCDALNWGGRPRPAETSLDQAEDELHAQREQARLAAAARRAQLVATARFTTTSVDPFDVLHLERTPHPEIYS